MTEPLDPLEPDVMAVLTRAKVTEAVPAGAGERIWAAVGARAALGANASKLATTPTSPATIPTGWVARHPFLAVGAGVAVGVVVGALAHGGSEPAPRVAPMTSLVATTSTPPAPPRASDWTESPHAAVPTPSAPEAHTTPAAAPAGQQLAAESALLDLARTAIARGEAAPAIAAVQRHETTFPQGMLREEREALAVKALVLGGHGDEARARAARFRARYPESLFLPALESALKSLRAPLPEGTTDPKP